MNRPSASRLDVDALERETGSGWSWSIFFGVALPVFAALASLNLPTLAAASLSAVGVFMLMGAVAQLAIRVPVPERGGTGFLVLSAVLYGAGGVMLIANPVLASEALTLVLASALILSGVMRIRLSAVMPRLPGWPWITASGLVTVVAGFAFAHFLLLRPHWLLGGVLAFDLLFQGVSAIAFGLALKRHVGRRLDRSFEEKNVREQARALPFAIDTTWLGT